MNRPDSPGVASNKQLSDGRRETEPGCARQRVAGGYPHLGAGPVNGGVVVSSLPPSATSGRLP